ncbi:unannotated protein [freshwater metagenome]|uniref:Unannotated protein n=1 Tax=freshwater metagenome TaxID=449393 RepID=A0A6J6HXB5_9ZZZZ
MTFGRGVQAINGFGGNVDGCVKTERVIGSLKVVVNGLRNAHHIDPGCLKKVCSAEGALATDNDQNIDLVIGQNFHDGLQVLSHGCRGYSGASQNGSAARQDATHLIYAEFNNIARNRTHPAITDTQNRVSIDGGLANYGAKDSVEAGTISPTGQHRNLHQQLHRFGRIGIVSFGRFWGGIGLAVFPGRFSQPGLLSRRVNINVFLIRKSQNRVHDFVSDGS